MKAVVREPVSVQAPTRTCPQANEAEEESALHFTDLLVGKSECDEGCHHGQVGKSTTDRTMEPFAGIAWSGHRLSYNYQLLSHLTFGLLLFNYAWPSTKDTMIGHKTDEVNLRN
jgi:hypothetical protein